MNKTKKIRKVVSHPQVAVIIVVLSVHESKLKILLYEREREPFEGILSLPAGLIFEKESLDHAAHRVLREKTGVNRVFLEQLYTFGEPDRDITERTIGVAYYVLLNFDELKIKEKYAGWYDVNNLGVLAFDHNEIVENALARTRAKMMYSNIVHGILPQEFTLTDLQKVYQVILGRKVDKRNFRKKILSLKILKDVKKLVTGKRQRPASLYKFKTTKTVIFKSEL
jgi:ADP-ribose pyrophosphatase YjhB (NUDIX family)